MVRTGTGYCRFIVDDADVEPATLVAVQFRVAEKLVGSASGTEYVAVVPATCTDPAPVTEHEIEGVGLPVAVSVNGSEAPSAMVAGVGEIDNVPEVGGTVTVTLVEPDLEESSVEVAVMVAVPVVVGV